MASASIKCLLIIDGPVADECYPWKFYLEPGSFSFALFLRKIRSSKSGQFGNLIKRNLDLAESRHERLDIKPPFINYTFRETKNLINLIENFLFETHNEGFFV